LPSTTDNPTAHRLLETFARFRRLGWRHTPFEGVTHSEFFILTTIKRAHAESGTGIRVSEISALLNVAPPTVTQQLNSLETHGYIERQIDKDDRRVIRVTLTLKGHELIHKAHEDFLSSISGLVEYLGEKDSDLLADLLTKVYDYFERFPDARVKQPR
jgi:DNA-binding MarR family transcriptional regulator